MDHLGRKTQLSGVINIQGALTIPMSESCESSIPNDKFILFYLRMIILHNIFHLNFLHI